MNSNVEKKVNDLQLNGFKISFNNVFSNASEIFKGIAGYAILAFVVYAICTSIINFIIEAIMPLAYDSTELGNVIAEGDYETALEMYSEGSSMLMTLLTNVTTALLSPILYSVYTMAHKFKKGETVEVSDIFVHYKNGKFLNLFLISLIVSFVSTIGFVLCLIPGFIIYTMWLLAAPFVIFADANVGEALSTSMKLAFKDFGTFSVTTLAIFGIIIVGFLLCCIGLIAAVPFVYVLIYALYNEVIGDDHKTEIDEIGMDIYKDNPYMK